MSAKKERPTKGTRVEPGMSMRDIAACLGTSTSWLSDCKAMAAIPAEDFETIIESEAMPSTEELVRIGRAIRQGRPLPPVLARGRVERALGIVKAMTVQERARFLNVLRLVE